MATNLLVPSASTNAAGVNQSSQLPRPTAPLQPAGGGSAPVGQLPFSGGASTGATGTSTGMPVAPGYFGAGGSSPYGTGSGSLYDPSTSSGYGGQSNIQHQLEAIYGKGTGGMLNNILQQMQGTDSAIFKQYLQSMGPQVAAEQAGLGAQLGGAGISGNSSVNAIAQSNLMANVNAQASAFDAELMKQQLQDTIGIVESTMPSAQKQVATSGWTIFGDVMNQITGDIGALSGGSGPNPSSNPANVNPNPSGDYMNQGMWGTTGYAPTMTPNDPSIPFQDASQTLPLSSTAIAGA